MSATILDKKRRTTLPESICESIGLRPNDQVEWRVEEGEIRGRKLIAQKPKEAFPRRSLLKYLTQDLNADQLAVLSDAFKDHTCQNEGPVRGMAVSVPRQRRGTSRGFDFSS